MVPKAAQRPRKKSTAAPAVLAPENLPFQLHLLVQSMTRKMQRLLTPEKLTPLHWGILCCLWRQDGLSPSGFGEQLTQLGGTITVALKGMEKRKLVQRRANPRDSRAAQVFLTDRGRALEERLVPAATLLIEELFQDFSPAEYARLAAAIDVLRSRADD